MRKTAVKIQEPAPADRQVNAKDFWKLMVPRITVLVTTVDAKGRADVAPFSFTAPVSFDPPMLMISVGLNKHSYWNIMQKKEFVVNLPTEKMLDKLWIAGGRWSEEESKIERAGLKTKKSDIVGPPVLTECAVSFECYVEDTKKCGDHIMILGRVVKIHVKEEFLDDEGRLKVDLVRPPLHVSDNLFAFPYVTKKA
ncbi:MAG: flavin reductase family protein [Candidatus Micrarchaeota archaeon]